MGRLFYIGVGAVGAIALRENSEMVIQLIAHERVNFSR
jgi:hypothetical protein